MLKDWLNKDVILNLENYKKEFECAEPFSHLSIENFLLKSKYDELKKACEIQEFYIEDHDLYRFNRTIDYKNSSNEIILEFRAFLKSKEFVEFMEELSGMSIDRKKMDLHSLRLENGDYLLCHDDDVQGRAIAFILNFSNFDEKEGGSLQIFDNENGEPTKIAKSIYPKENKFNFFKVTPQKSYHQIEEVMADKQRNSISGWFYKNE